MIKGTTTFYIHNGEIKFANAGRTFSLQVCLANAGVIYSQTFS